MTPADQHPAVRNEQVLARQLSAAQQTAMALGGATAQGSPVNALLVSSLGLGGAVLVRALWPGSAYVWFFGVALFGALFVWRPAIDSIVDPSPLSYRPRLKGSSRASARTLLRVGSA